MVSSRQRSPIEGIGTHDSDVQSTSEFDAAMLKEPQRGWTLKLYQIFHWLKWGRWRPIPLAEGLKWIGLREPRLAWGSAKKVLHWLLTLPLSLALGVFIIGVMLAYSEVADRTATSRRGGAN